MENNKKSFFESLKIWLGMGVIMFGTYCGANMASGGYAAGYMVTVGGGWMLVWLGIFFVCLAFFCTIGMNYVRCFNLKNYREYYLTLWGLNKPKSKKILKILTMVFFDIYGICMGLCIVGGTFALFNMMSSSFFHIPQIISGLVAVALFALLTVNGAAFLRKFNGVMTVSLVVCLFLILFAAISDRGGVLLERLGNFQIGTDWNGTSVSSHAGTFAAYCCTTCAWGATMCPYAAKIKTKKDAIGAGITMAVLAIFLFGLTSLIVLPYMPEVFGDAPILEICKEHLPKYLSVIYWVVVLFSIITTAPTYTYNMSIRWCAAWKSDKLSDKKKLLIVSVIYLLLAWLVSGIGMMNIVQKVYGFLGELALIPVVIPLLITIYRVAKRDRAAKEGRLPEASVY